MFSPFNPLYWFHINRALDQDRREGPSSKLNVCHVPIVPWVTAKGKKGKEIIWLRKGLFKTKIIPSIIPLTMPEHLLLSRH